MNRKCSNEKCSTILSAYNQNDFCHLCLFRIAIEYGDIETFNKVMFYKKLLKKYNVETKIKDPEELKLLIKQNKINLRKYSKKRIRRKYANKTDYSLA